MGSRLGRNRLSRRQFMRLAMATGLGAALTSCGAEEAATPEAPVRAEPSPVGSVVYPTDVPTLTPGTPVRVEPSPVGSTAYPTEAPTLTPGTPVRAEPSPVVSAAYLAVARGLDPGAITRAALAALGGIERFVKSGNDVIIKPNICVDYRSYEYAATTNPEVVAALVELCLGAGAKRVRVMDTPFGGSPEGAYARSGIEDAVKAAGGVMEIMNRAKFRAAEVPDGRDLSSVEVYQDILTTDVLIDVPIAKHHSLARLTLAGKNLFGTISRPGQMHANLGQRAADLVSLIRPTLTVVDAVRTLMANGPTGGNLDDVRLNNTVIASHDIVAADAYAATLFGLTGAQIGYVKAAADMGLGTLDLDSIKIEEIAI